MSNLTVMGSQKHSPRNDAGSARQLGIVRSTPVNENFG